MFLGVCIWTMMRNPPYEDTIREIADMGFKGVELIGWTEEAYREYYTHEKNKELKKLIADLGLTLTNFNYNALDLSQNDPAMRKANMEIYKMALETAYELGAKTFTNTCPYPFSLFPEYPMVKDIPIMGTLSVNADMNRDWEANYQIYVESVRECCKLAKEAGLKVLIEAHPYRWIHNVDGMLRLYEKVGMDNLGFNFDPSHLHQSGEIPQCAIYQLRGKLHHVHLSDNDTFTNAHWRPGQGKMDWPAIIKALSDIGYDGGLSLELEDVPGACSKFIPATPAIKDELRLSVQYLERVFAELGLKLEK